MATISFTNEDWGLVDTTLPLTNTSGFSCYIAYSAEKPLLKGGVGTIGITLSPGETITPEGGSVVWATSNSKYHVTLSY